MHVRINQYNDILGIKGRISASELKRFYRIKAKALHPDRNPDPNSHEQFVLLHEAYEFYTRALTEDDPQIFNSKKYPKHYHTEKWNYKQRLEARRKAARRAKMRYAYFERKGYPQMVDKFFKIFDLLKLLLTGVIVIVLPVFLYAHEGSLGIIMAILVQLFTFPIWSKAIMRFL